MATATAPTTKTDDDLIRQALRLLVPRVSRYWVHVPEPPQQAFLLLNDEEAFYGGAAGGGKSDAILSGALQYVDQPDYHALIFRRTFKNLSLPGAIMSRSLEWLSGTDAVWNAANHEWSFPSGATLTFGHLQYEHDKFDYASSEFQYIGFDELTEFTESQYRFLFSRLRRKEGSKIPLRMRAASNPGGIGHEWVKRRFIDEGLEHGRPFIPAKLQDNPHLDREQYVKSLMNLDPLTRKRLLEGDWSVRPIGALFRREWFKVVDALPATVKGRPVRRWDLAATEDEGGNDPDWTAGALVAELANRQFIIMDIERFRSGPGEVERRIERTAIRDGRRTKIRVEQEPGSSGKSVVHYYIRKLVGFDVKGRPSTGDKVVRAGAFASQAQIGNILLLRGSWIGDFLDEAEHFGAEGGWNHDDQVDAATGGFDDLISEPSGQLRTA